MKKKKQGKIGYREKDGTQKFTALRIDECQIPSVVAKFSCLAAGYGNILL